LSGGKKVCACAGDITAPIKANINATINAAPACPDMIKVSPVARPRARIQVK
jgi:hypothetical protein